MREVGRGGRGLEGSSEGARVGFGTLVIYCHLISRRGSAGNGLLVITRGRGGSTTRARFHNGGGWGVAKRCNVIRCFVQKFNYLIIICWWVRWSAFVVILRISSDLVLAGRSLIGEAGLWERWGRREGRRWRSWWTAEWCYVEVQVGQLLLQSLDVSPELPGHELFILPVPVGSIYDAPELADVLLQGLDFVVEKSVFGQGLQVICTGPARHRR